MDITFVFPRFKTFSGAEHLALQLANYAEQGGYQVFILTRGFDKACIPYLPEGTEVKSPRFISRLTGNHLVDSFLDVVSSPLLLKDIPDQTDVLCFFCDPTLPALWMYKRVLRGKVPTVYYCLQPPRFAYDLMSETVEANKPLGYLVPVFAVPYRVIDRIAACSGDQLWTLSHDYARWCQTLYEIPAVQVMPPGVDLDLSNNPQPERARDRHGIRPEEKIVVTVNKLIPRKNLDVFLRAMRIVTERIPETKGIIVGDGPARSTLQALANELGLNDKIIFTGFVSSFSEVINYYAASSVYVFLERNVPFGLTVLEASICEKPVVAVRGGGTLETVIDGETGFLVSSELHPKEVADKICWLLQHEEKRIAMGKRAAQHAKNFSWETQARKFIEALEEIVANHN